MIQLLLSEPTWNSNEDHESLQHITCLLKNLESIIWSLLSSCGRSEARLWLCNSLSSISSITHRYQCELFLNLLRSKAVKTRGLAAQILRIIFEKQPNKAGQVLARKSYMLENFFKGHPRRILQWFSSFGSTVDSEHRKGAKALSQFAFINRDLCWEELEWKGKHGQSPATVATKPHYFLDLDVQRTVDNFLEYVPEFWSSYEFSESLKDGEIFSLDIKFFIDLFLDLMYKEDLKEIWEVIEDFLMEESFSFLCQHLLIILEESELHVFLGMICKYLIPRMNSVEVGNWYYLLEIILARCGFDSLDQLIMLNAVVSQGRQLLRLVQEEGGQGEKVKIKDLVLQISSSDSNNLTDIIKECLKTKSIELIKWLGLQAWALHYRMSEEFLTAESWESLFISNGIRFQKSDKYALVNNDGSSEQGRSDLDERASSRTKKKKKEKHRKRRRKNFDLDYCDDGLLDFNLPDDKLDFQSMACSWMLSLDGFSTSWSSVDLPEYLSKYCFSIWMKWIFAKWTDVA